MLAIRKMGAAHAKSVLQMMRDFYASPAVSTNGSEAIFQKDIANCLNDNPYLEGYVFLDGETVAGYAMLAKSFSTEFGRPCVWIEDIYLLPAYRGQGTAGRFFDWLEEQCPGVLLRLEVEEDNTSALRAYRKNGFDHLPYLEMKKQTREE